MGEAGQGGGDSVDGRDLTPAARVVPDVASFSVDDGFWYSIPQHLIADVAIGSIVRVPLGARRLRGWVVEIADRDGKLKDIAGVSSSMPVFDDQLLKALFWTAHHYLAPTAALLRRASPPNLPRAAGSPPTKDLPSENVNGPMSELAKRSAAGGTSPISALVTASLDRSWVEDLRRVLAAGRSVLVVVATAAEAKSIASAAIHSTGPTWVAVVTGESDADDTKAWERAQTAPCLLVGTPKVAAWRVADLGLAVVVEEGRRAMKDRQTPTVHVREVMVTRSRLERFNLVFVGPTPSVETLALGAELVRARGRPWGLVEVVDTTEARGGALVANRTLAAMRAMGSEGRQTFVFTHRRVDQASARCASCRRPRRCGSCGRRVGLVDVCPHCATPSTNCQHCDGQKFEPLGTIPEQLVASINKRWGAIVAGVFPSGTPIQVGTERDLTSLNHLDLAVAADVDGVAAQPGHRASEEALRQLARVAGAVHRRPGARLILQTTTPDSDLVRALTRGDPVPYLENVSGRTCPVRSAPFLRDDDRRSPTGGPRRCSRRHGQSRACRRPGPTSRRGWCAMASHGSAQRDQASAALACGSVARWRSHCSHRCRSDRPLVASDWSASTLCRLTWPSTRSEPSEIPFCGSPPKPIAEIDDVVRQLAADMIETMYAAPGVGLAANQIGVSRQIAVFDADDELGARVMINPELVETAGEIEWG